MAGEPHHLYVTTPCYGGMAHAAYMRSILALHTACAARNLPLQYNLGGGEALINRYRAGAMAMFLGTPATHLLFIDADISFAPNQVFRLLDAGKSVVGGVYPRKPAVGVEPTLEIDLLPESLDITDGNGFRRVASVGAGFLLITRGAAQQLDEAYPRLRAGMRDVNNSPAAAAAMVFDSMIEPDSGRYLADHQGFCRRWRDQGGEVWADIHTSLTHHGDAAWETAELG